MLYAFLGKPTMTNQVVQIVSDMSTIQYVMSRPRFFLFKTDPLAVKRCENRLNIRVWFVPSEGLEPPGRSVYHATVEALFSGRFNRTTSLSI